METSANFVTNFLGITSITITRQGGGVFNPAIDNVVMDASLPVELTSFTASVSGGKVTLDWQTATEQTNYGLRLKENPSKSPPKGRLPEWENGRRLDLFKEMEIVNSTKEYSFY